MQEIPLWYLGFVLLSTLLAIAAVWARRSIAARIGAVMLLAVMLTLQFVALTDLLSRPKPAELETATNTIEEAKVLAASIREGVAIYVWLRIEDTPEPRYYALPWRQKSAVELQRAMRESRRHGGEIVLKMPFASSMELREPPTFYALPPPALPRKPAPNPFEYRHPSVSA